MADTLANKKIVFTTQQLVIIVVFIVGLLGTWFNGYLEYKLLQIEVQELRDDLEEIKTETIESIDYERKRFERKLKRLEENNG